MLVRQLLFTNLTISNFLPYKPFKRYAIALFGRMTVYFVEKPKSILWLVLDPRSIPSDTQNLGRVGDSFG